MTPVGVLVMYHGTPRSMDELGAFYTEIRRGRPPTPEQLADLRGRYEAIGGLSPLTARTAAQVEGLASALEARRPGRYLVVSGAKYSSPRIEDAVRTLADAGVRRVVGIVLAPHSSQVSVGEYRRRAHEAAASTVRGGPIELETIDHWHLAPGLISLLAERVDDALGCALTPAGSPQSTVVLFTAHSVPTNATTDGDDYATQVHESARAVADAAMIPRWQVAWQSGGRSGGSWLGPDVCEVIAQLPTSGATGVVVCPVGFVSDHLEVLYDLDVEAASCARHAGLAFARTASFNDDPRFCEVLATVVTAADPAP